MDENKNIETEVKDNPGSAAEQSQPDIQTALAQSMADAKRYKSAFDKTSSELADLKKKYTALLSDEQKASVEKAEREAEQKAYVESLEKFKAVTEAKDQYRRLGYSDELAKSAAEAQFAGDFEELARIQQGYQDELAKQIKADLMKSMPAPATGNDDSVQVTKEQFKAMSYREQVEFKRNHPTAYEKLAR